MECERETLYVRIKRAAQIKGDPLPDAGSEVLFRVRRDSIERRNEYHGQAGKLHNGKLVSGAKVLHEVQDGSMRPARLQDIVNHDLQRPGLEQVGHRLSDNGQETNGQSAPMRSQQLAYGEALEPPGRLVPLRLRRT